MTAFQEAAHTPSQDGRQGFETMRMNVGSVAEPTAEDPTTPLGNTKFSELEKTH